MGDIMKLNQDGRTCTHDTLIKYQLLCFLSYVLIGNCWKIPLPVYTYYFGGCRGAADCMHWLQVTLYHFENEKSEKNEITYSIFIKLVYSILTLSAVAFRPIRIATSFHVISSNTRYRMIRCIRCGIVSIHAST